MINKIMNNYNFIKNFIFVNKYLPIFIDCNNKLQKCCKEYNKKSRNLIIPECLTETIAQLALCLNNIYCYKSDIGDLECIIAGQKKCVEVKSCSSDGPISFGPKQNNKNILVLVDARDYKKYNFKVYLITELSDLLNNLKINKNETFKNQADNGRRPRINPTIFLEYAKKYPDNYKEIFNGNISGLNPLIYFDKKYKIIQNEINKLENENKSNDYLHKIKIQKFKHKQRQLYNLLR